MAEDPERETGSGNVVGLVFVVVILALVIWLAHALYQNLQLQKCQLEGRRDCIAVPQSDAQ
jgi:hypothetical protein